MLLAESSYVLLVKLYQNANEIFYEFLMDV